MSTVTKLSIISSLEMSPLCHYPITHLVSTDTAVVRTLGPGETILGPTEGVTVLVEQSVLLNTMFVQNISLTILIISQTCSIPNQGSEDSARSMTSLQVFLLFVSVGCLLYL